jgi:hypothetical protein
VLDAAILSILLSVTPAQAPVTPPVAASRGALYQTLEVAYLGLQGLDTAATLMAVDRGLVEANPVLRGLPPAGVVVLKAAVTVGTVLLTRTLANRHRVSAVLLMVAVDGVYGFVVARNVALIRR